jgi:O-antigen ligase
MSNKENAKIIRDPSIARLGDHMTQARQANFNNWLFFLIAACPALMPIVPWDFGQNPTKLRLTLNSNSLVVSMVEIIIALLILGRMTDLTDRFYAVPRLTRYALAFLAISTLGTSFAVSAHPANAILAWIVFALHAVFALLMLAAAETFDKAARQKLAGWIAIGVAAYCLVWAASLPFYPLTGDQWVKKVPGVTNVRWTGFFVVSGFFAAMAVLPQSNTAIARNAGFWWAMVGGSIALTLGIWTGSRGAIVATIVGAIAAIALSTNNRKTLLCFVVSSFIIATVLANVLPLPNPQYGMFRIFSSISGGADVSSGRLQIWADTMRLATEQPLLGWGLDQFFASEAANGILKNPHSVIAQSFFSVGSIGVGLLIASVAPLIRYVRIDRAALASVSFLAGGVAYLIYSIYDAALYYNYPIMMLIIFAALALTPIKPPAAIDKSD